MNSRSPFMAGTAALFSRRTLLHFSLLLCCLQGVAQYKVPPRFGSDHVTSFHSIIRIRPDGRLLVTETIRIYNGDGVSRSESGKQPDGSYINNEIQRGIVRTLPIFYMNEHHLFQNVDFDLKQVYRDGRKSEHHEETKGNGIIIYTGSEDEFLENGYYTYTLVYETGRQLKDLPGSDELYWNVTGNGWSFAIDSASCDILLPPGTKPRNTHCYTGVFGSSDSDCVSSVSTRGDTSVVSFRATRAFNAFQGLTVDVSWPKGAVTFPGITARFFNVIADNRGIFLLPLAAIFSVVFLSYFWKRYGRDPKAGTIYPRFDPPPGLSPAAVGYIHWQEYGNQMTAAMLVDAAVRKIIKIDVEREGLLFKHNEYLISLQPGEPLQATSQYDDFITEIKKLDGSRIEKGKFNKALADLGTAIQAHCEATYKKKDGRRGNGSKGMFANNWSFLILPLLVCLAAGFFGFATGVVRAISMLDWHQPLWFFFGIVICFIILRFFWKVMPAYSHEGRKIADHIEGFRMFLVTADEHRFNALAPGGKSLELFERYLPFAIALNAELEWGKQFREVIEAASLQPTNSMASSGLTYALMSHSGGSFSSNLTSSFSGAISSASTPPSSSSGGSSGGGFSGGGGGGGGGGGW